MQISLVQWPQFSHKMTNKLYDEQASNLLPLSPGRSVILLSRILFSFYAFRCTPQWGIINVSTFFSKDRTLGRTFMRSVPRKIFLATPPGKTLISNQFGKYFLKHLIRKLPCSFCTLRRQREQILSCCVFLFTERWVMAIVGSPFQTHLSTSTPTSSKKVTEFIIFIKPLILW